MTARADGLWWARHDTTGGGAPWRGVTVDGPKVYIPGWAGPMDVDDEFIEWGPYLGKEPGDQNRLPGLSRWGKLAPAGADIATIADHADDCTCDWCHRLTESEVNAIEARLRQAEETPTP